MGKKKVLIVDDSPFSRSLLAEALINGGFEVAGEAGQLQEAVEVYRQAKPDLVTMDIALPGSDGLECTRVLMAEDPGAKVVLVSSMKDEVLLREAKLLNVSGYIQKPFEAEELTQVLRSVFEPEQDFEQLVFYCKEAFCNALTDGVKRVTKTAVSKIQDLTSSNHVVSSGIAIIVGMTGKYPGRMIMDMSADTAYKMAQAGLKREPKDERETLAMVAEFANIISGNACSNLNRRNSQFNLRVAPPSIMQGLSPEIISLHLDCQKAMEIDTEFGTVFLNLGFKRRLQTWM